MVNFILHSVRTPVDDSIRYLIRAQNTMWNRFWQALIRRKRNDLSESKLARVLTLFDLTALGVGSTLGLGAYVLAGSVAFDQAGPAVTISFVIAAIASGFAGICYAEFAARVPKAGSAYVYSYVTIGEFVAFTIGWNLILEYVIGTSSVARGLSGYLDALMDNKMSKALESAMPIRVNFMASYPDFLSFFMVLLVAALLCVGVKESSWLNIIFTSVNLTTISIMIVAGAMNSDPANWAIPKDTIPEGVNGGEGGFMPFGIAGVMAGAAKCFYGFVGFDCVATTGEEAINPERNIPWAIVMSLTIIFLSYFGVSTVLTMMWPYYLQSPTAPFIEVFDHIGWQEIKWIVTIGAIFALCTNLLGAMFPLPRVLYAMSSDGILYKRLKVINLRTKTPLLATVLSGLLSAFMSLLFDLHQLIDMMSIGTLIAYTIVSICVLVLRYQSDDTTPRVSTDARNICLQSFNLKRTDKINNLTSNVAVFGIIAYSLFAIAFCGVLQAIQFQGNSVPMTVGLSILGVVMLLLVTMIARQPTIEDALTFKVPFVPWVPCLSVLINLYLMFQLDIQTWIRFGVWAAIGYFIYFTYGIRHSVEGALLKVERRDGPKNGIENSGYVLHVEQQIKTEAADSKPSNGDTLI